MIRINLLPPEEHLPKWNEKKIFMVFSAAVLMVLATIFLFNQGFIYYQEQLLADTRHRAEELSITKEKMQQALAQQQAITQKESLLIQLGGGKIGYGTQLGQLVGKMPDQLWLTNVEMQNNLMKIQGVTLDYPALITFMHTLEQDQQFTEPVLIRAELDDSHNLSKFEMLVKIRGK